MKVDRFFPRILLATAAADLAIDRHDVGIVLNLEWPEDVGSAVQRRGRAGRMGHLASFILIASLSAYTSMISRIVCQLEGASEEDTDDDTIIGFNTDMSPKPKRVDKDRT